MKIAIIGATGLVGNEMIKVLEEREFPVSEICLAASSSSVGKELKFNNKLHKVVRIEDAITFKPDIALFSAGKKVSKEYARKFVNIGTIVIDNSSEWRMNPQVPLVIPEINPEELKNAKLIANPNCSTIQMLMAIAPLHRLYKIKRLVISTYQSVSGTGKLALEQLEEERNGNISLKAYPFEIDMNVIPHCDVFEDNLYTREEMKLVNETHKILKSPGIKITATAVRVPVSGGHSESVNVEFERPFELEDVLNALDETENLVLERNSYPMPKFIRDTDEVYVGRVRRDFSIENGLNLWIVADNLRKGAATNAVQIAEIIYQTGGIALNDGEFHAR